MLSALAQLIDTLPTHWRLARSQRGAAAATRADLRFVDLGSTIVRMRQAGTRGPSLVLGTDPPVPLELYDDLIAALADRYRVTVFELPGFGCSLPRAGFRFSLDNAVAVVTSLLERIGNGPHVLALPCVTAYVAIGIARRRPDLVEKLVLAQTPTWQGAQDWLQQRDPKGLLRRPLLGQLALLAMRRRRIRQWYASALAQPELLDTFAQATLSNFDHGGCFCLASGFQHFMRDHAGHVGPVAQDTLIVWGRADPSHAATDMAATRSLAPNSCSLVLEGVGHFPELEASARFVEALDAFAGRSQSLSSAHAR